MKIPSWNDYVVFDPNKNELELNSENVKMICDRNEGLGSDGVLEVGSYEDPVLPVILLQKLPVFAYLLDLWHIRVRIQPFDLHLLFPEQCM